MFDVITLGSATVDVFAKSSGSLIKIYTDNKETSMLAFKSGTKLLMEEPVYTIGGGGTNAAVSLSRMGLKTAYLGKIGNGPNGRRVLLELRKKKVDTSLVKRSKQHGHTGFSIILDSADMDRVVLTHKGVNDSMTPEDINFRKISAKWIYAASLMGRSFSTLRKIVLHAKKKGIRILLNPSSYMTKKGIGFLKGIIEHVDILVFNKEEAAELSQKEDISGMFHELHKAGPEIVIITDGKNGVHASDREYHYYAKAKRTRVIDATGAGDAFASAFLAGYIKKGSIEFGLRIGMINASGVLSQVGAKNGLLSYPEAIRRMKPLLKIDKKRFR